MTMFLASARQWLRQNVWQPISALVDLFHWLPPLAAVIIFALLAYVGQIYELYYTYLEENRFLPILFAVVALTVLSVTLQATHYWLSRIREKVVFATHTRPNIGVDFRRFRRGVGWVLAFTPWFGFAVGLAVAGNGVIQRQNKLNAAMTLLSVPMNDQSLDLIWKVGISVIIIIVAGLVITTMIHVLRRSKILSAIAAALALSSIIFIAAVPYFYADSVSIYREIGPLAAMVTTMLFFYSIMALFAMLSQRSKYPALTVAIIAIAIGVVFQFSFANVMFTLFLIFGVFATLAAFARLWSTVGLTAFMSILALVACYRDLAEASVWNSDPNVAQAVATPHGSDNRTFANQRLNAVFEEWLAGRKAATGKFPVFIIAVEGGGIYAASAAGLFLAKLQDDVPDFSKHVFAISAVSGGAIGATIFQALVHTSVPPAQCPNRVVAMYAGNLQQEISCILQGDHFSPVVGAIIPDLVGEAWGRAQELEASFLESVAAVNPAAAARLKGPYLDHWSNLADPTKWSNDTGPALVLNTTSAETGYRVAFAPFALNPDGDNTLFSLSDADLTEEFSDPNQTGESVPLMFAAIASARFPVILPPYAISVKASGSSGPRHWWNLFSDIFDWVRPGAANNPSDRWNLVDGGYADNSGAATALDLYNSLAYELKDRQDVDLKLIVLTSDEPSPNFSKMVGTAYGDTVAPVEAVLSVRSGLANQAVTRACDYFKEQPTGAGEAQRPCATETSQSERPWHIKLIRLQDEAYGLALGWEISRSSFTVVSTFVGNSNYCKPVPQPISEDNLTEAQQQTLKTARAIANNSCVLLDVETALKSAN